ncbi:MAG: hypothetical protein K8R21_06945 [Leptospira sp.]|nr:hypothetical protein [Leptospira sp.]
MQKRLESAGKLVDLSLIRVQGEPLTPELVQLVISNDQICFTEYSDHKNYFEYVLHKSCIPQAIEFAKLLYKNSNNDTEIRILARMNIGELVSPEQKKDFEQHELKSLFKYLSFFTRLWRSIFGNVVVHKFEANQIRARQEVLQRQRIQQQKMKKMEEEKTRIAESRMKIKAEKSGQDATNEETEETETEETGASMNPEQEKEVKEQMQNLVNIVDEGWNAGIYPDRTFLLQNLKGKMTEEQLVMFLKKYSQKELYSFIIKTHTEKFPWPILISRHYLKRYGRKLLDKAKKESDEQRSGLMPNQEKFDISSAIEDFLERTLPKI